MSAYRQPVERVPARAVLAGHYAAWLVVSVIVAWMVLS